MLSKALKKYKQEFWLIGLTMLLGAGMFFYVLSLGLTRALTDQNAHLDASRFVLDSMTPGISQIGFWPPLLHVLMLPFAYFNNFYQTGAAGAMVLIPALALAAIFLYRLSLLFTKDKTLSFVAALLLILNPYVLYYSVTPMMEVLFIANLFGVAYFLAQWLAQDRLKYLILMGIFVTLASLSRYEGLILIPLCTLIVLVQMLRKNRNYSQIEALFILFGLLAGLGLAAVSVYSLIFSGNPLTFTGGSWLRNPPIATFPTKGSVVDSIRYMLYSSFYMFSKPMVYLSIVSFAIFAVLSRFRFRTLAVLSVLFSPFLFIGTTLYTGTASIAVPNLPPFGFFLNERYSLTWIGFIILAPILLISAIQYYFSKSDLQWMQGAAVLARNFLVVLLAALVVYQFINISFQQTYPAIAKNINVPLQDQVQVTNYLSKHYDFGKILITKADNDPIIAQAGIPLSDYIYEGNYLYFNQSNQEPWLFARFVVMHNPADSDPWSRQNEAIMDQWGNSDEFNKYYDLVLQNATRKVYEVNTQKVLAMARAQHLDISQIPSINRNVSWWDPTNIYAKIQNLPAVGSNTR